MPTQFKLDQSPNKLLTAINYIYDTDSGVFRAVTQADLPGGGSGGATAANQLDQIAQIDDLTTSDTNLSYAVDSLSVRGVVYANDVANSRFSPVNMDSGRLNTYPTGPKLPITNLPSGSSGQHSPLSFNADNGALLAQIPNLERSSDSVTAYAPAGATVLGTQGVRSGNGTVLNATQRNQGYVSNVGTTPMFVALSGLASPANYSFILKGGTAPFDGNGASWSANDWYGSVSVSGSGILYTAWEY